MSSQELGHGNPMEDTGTDIAIRDHSTEVAVGRESAEIQAAVVMARQFPRNEAAAYTKLKRACKRPRFASEARYVFDRAGTKVTGPSVKLAREAARCWGNMRHGLRIVSMDEDTVHVRGWAVDLETNTYAEAEDRFRKLVERGRGQNKHWRKPNERELRELVGKHGAICVRNAILQLIPEDVIQDMMDEVAAVVERVAQGMDPEQDVQSVVRALVVSFRDLGVSAEMLEKYLGHSTDLVTNEQVVDLRGVYTALRDGAATRDDYFKVPGAKPTRRSVLDDDED